MTPHEAVERVITALRAADLAHLVTGALASNHYGIERSTKDADIVLETAPGDFASFTEALGPALKLDAQVTLNPEIGTTDYTDYKTLGSTVILTRWVND